MIIRNHRIDGGTYKESPNRGGTINPKFIVMHYTAGYTAESAINTLTRSGSSASAHVVVDYNGDITQLVPFNVKAWHAGPSRYAGYSGLNDYSIGIEIVNIGWLRKAGSKYQDSYGNLRTKAQLGELVESPNARVGSGTFYWPVYPEAQLAAVEELTKSLIDSYGIIDIVSHEQIDTRGWKTDPGPAFPMKRFTKLISDRNVDSPMYEVTASHLNVRSGPGTNFDVIGSIKDGDVVNIYAIHGDWGKIDQNGWVHMDYLRRI